MTTLTMSAGIQDKQIGNVVLVEGVFYPALKIGGVLLRTENLICSELPAMWRNRIFLFGRKTIYKQDDDASSTGRKNCTRFSIALLFLERAICHVLPFNVRIVHCTKSLWQKSAKSGQNWRTHLDDGSNAGLVGHECRDAEPDRLPRVEVKPVTVVLRRCKYTNKNHDYSNFLQNNLTFLAQMAEAI